MNFSDLDAAFAKYLSLDIAPVAVSFRKSAPAGVRAFAGSAPSGCSFWKIAADLPRGKSAFTTVGADHFNCPIGAYTHRIDLPKERAQELPGKSSGHFSHGNEWMNAVGAEDHKHQAKQKTSNQNEDFHLRILHLK